MEIETDAPTFQPGATWSIAYWVLCMVLVTYVGWLSPQRSESLLADAWEHHRVVKALTEKLWSPSNPTYATDDPSVRHSPYSVALAVICRATDLSPYTMLTFAAAMNTLALLAALWWFLAGFGQQRSGFGVVICIIFLYGAAPGYANSLALSDLPWLMVNPSAFTMALNFVGWSIFWRAGDSRLGTKLSAWITVAALIALGTLTHGMTGVLGGLGIAAMAVVAPPGKRLQQVLGVIVIGATAFGLCAVWPWYPFYETLLGGRDNWFWYNPAILKLMFFTWCAPAYLLLLATLPMRANPVIRWCLYLSGAAIAMGTAASVLRSPALARLPLAALPIASIAVGNWSCAQGLWSLSALRRIFSELLARSARTNAQALIHTMFFVALAFGAVPQMWDILSLPHLARTYMAPLIGREDKQPRYWENYEEVLADVGTHDVVLSDLETAWPVPSFNGRIVAAIHLEFFTADQEQRVADVERVFATERPDERARIIKKYGVKYILISRTGAYADRIHASAIQVENHNLVLMDAQRWLAAESAAAEPDIVHEIPLTD
jgi:hypothetical protein